jgi:hypothetical protein
MKRIVILFLCFLVPFIAFTQNDDLPVFMTEINSGYAAGINLDNLIFLDVKIIYPYEKFGFVIEAGSMFTPDSSTIHVFLGPMMFLLNNSKWRVPLALGLDYFHGDTLYYGLGGIISLHHRLTNYFYAGLNLAITYAFNNVYDELTGYRTIVTTFDDGTTKTQTVPVIERKDHYGSYIYFKPSILVGIQL